MCPNWRALAHAITDALRDMARHPFDDVQEIWNEHLKGWETGLKMNYRLEIDREE